MLFSLFEELFSEKEQPDPVERFAEALPYLQAAAYEADEEERYRRSFDDDDEDENY